MTNTEKMKPLLLLVMFLSIFQFVNAQKFFYVDAETDWEKLIKEKLLKMSQFVARSRLESDYIVRPEISFETNSNIQTVRISVIDTVTSKTIFLAEENYPGNISETSSTFLKTAMELLMEKNSNEIIQISRHESYLKFARLLKARKDKT